jgi:hypothetical protein
MYYRTCQTNCGGKTVNSILAKQYLNLTLQETAYVLPTLPNNISPVHLPQDFLYDKVLPNNMWDFDKPCHFGQKKSTPFGVPFG